MPVINSESWNTDSQEARMKKGKLVKVQKGPGQWVKMYEEDARRLGLLPAEAAKPPEAKMRKPSRNKAIAPAAADAPEEETPKRKRPRRCSPTSRASTASGRPRRGRWPRMASRPSRSCARRASSTT